MNKAELQELATAVADELESREKISSSLLMDVMRAEHDVSNALAVLRRVEAAMVADAAQEARRA